MDNFYKKRILPTAFILLIALIITIVQAKFSWSGFHRAKSVHSDSSEKNTNEWTEDIKESSLIKRIFDDCLNVTLILCVERLQRMHQEMKA
jgi:hypothetical protein